MRHLGYADRECFAVVLLDVRGRLVKTVKIAEGSLAQCPVSPRDALREAVRIGSHSVIHTGRFGGLRAYAKKGIFLRARTPRALLGRQHSRGSACLPRGSQAGDGARAASRADRGQVAGREPLRGFQGAGVLEVVESHDGNTYRAVYTVKLQSGVYALHAFQKKSHRGVATDQRDIDLVRKRLRDAEEIDRMKRTGTGRRSE